MHLGFSRYLQWGAKCFEGPHDNMLHSIATYFLKGVMGKRKYRATYKALSMKKVT